MQFIHLTGLSAVFFASIVSAQSPAISQSEGTVFVQDKPLLQPATLPDGSVVRTAEASRVEIRLRGGVLHVGANSSVRILENRPYNFNRFEVLSGSVVLSTDRDGSASAVCENAIQFSESGVYRFDRKDDCRFRVYQGAASVQLPSLPVVLTSGGTMNLNRGCGDMVPHDHFNTQEIDNLDRWSRERRQ